MKPTINRRRTKDAASPQKTKTSSFRTSTKEMGKDSKPDVPRKKAKLTHSTTVGNKKLTCQLEFESEEIPECGSTEMYSAIFKAAKYSSAPTADDLDKINDEVRRFLGRPLSTDKIPKSKPVATVTSVPNAEAETDVESDTEELLRECRKLLNDEEDEEKVVPHNDSGFGSSVSVSASTSRSNRNVSRNNSAPESRGRQRKKRKKKEPKIIDLVSLSSDDEDTPPPQVPDLSDLIFFSVVYFNKRYSMHFHKKDSVKLIRENLAKVTNLVPEGFEMYLGEDVRLEDDQTLQDVNMTENCEIDAFYTEKPLEELYSSGAMSILRFKLQTHDRTGRQTIFVYVKNSSPMRAAQEQYAERFGLDANKISLRFDGDTVSLDSTPEQNDLEGEECIDVIVSEK